MQVPNPRSDLDLIAFSTPCTYTLHHQVKECALQMYFKIENFQSRFTNIAIRPTHLRSVMSSASLALPDLTTPPQIRGSRYRALYHEALKPINIW